MDRYLAADDLVWGERKIARGEHLPADAISDPALVRCISVGLVAPANEVDDGWEVARRPLVIGDRTIMPGERLRPEMRLDRAFVRLRERGFVRRADVAVEKDPPNLPASSRATPMKRTRPRAS